MAIFDECYSSHADLSHRPADLEQFWEKQIAQLKKIPLDVRAQRKTSRKLLTEQNLAIEFQSAGKYHLQARFIAPRKLFGRPPLVVIFPDYGCEPIIFKGLMNAGIAQLVVRMRGHEAPRPVATEQPGGSKEKKREERQRSYGYFAEHLLEPEEHYAAKIYLDAYRTLEMARLRREIDSSRIGIIGYGVGAAQALFVAAFMRRGEALYLDNPAFVHLDVTQNLAEADYAREINEAARGNKKLRQQIKTNLRYFDPVYFADRIRTPVAFSVNLTNKLIAPHGAFALFHLLQCEKDMYLFTEGDPVALAEERRKSAANAVRFFRYHLLGESEAQSETGD
ncbi:MAG: acetylxylan esterase [Turneriella sp.]|nr:acetylxylan esterase [Turneriella sp.]